MSYRQRLEAPSQCILERSVSKTTGLEPARAVHGPRTNCHRPRRHDDGPGPHHGTGHHDGPGSNDDGPGAHDHGTGAHDHDVGLVDSAAREAHCVRLRKCRAAGDVEHPGWGTWFGPAVLRCLCWCLLVPVCAGCVPGMRCWNHWNLLYVLCKSKTWRLLGENLFLAWSFVTECETRQPTADGTRARTYSRGTQAKGDSSVCVDNTKRALCSASLQARRRAERGRALLGHTAPRRLFFVSAPLLSTEPTPFHSAGRALAVACVGRSPAVVSRGRSPSRRRVAKRTDRPSACPWLRHARRRGNIGVAKRCVARAQVRVVMSRRSPN